MRVADYKRAIEASVEFTLDHEQKYPGSNDPCRTFAAALIGRLQSQDPVSSKRIEKVLWPAGRPALTRSVIEDAPPEIPGILRNQADIQ